MSNSSLHLNQGNVPERVGFQLAKSLFAVELPRVFEAIVEANVPAVWAYVTDDSKARVLGRGYFSNNILLAKGDVIIVRRVPQEDFFVVRVVKTDPVVETDEVSDEGNESKSKKVVIAQSNAPKTIVADGDHDDRFKSLASAFLFGGQMGPKDKLVITALWNVMPKADHQTVALEADGCEVGAFQFRGDKNTVRRVITIQGEGHGKQKVTVAGEHGSTELRLNLDREVRLELLAKWRSNCEHPVPTPPPSITLSGFSVVLFTYDPCCAHPDQLPEEEGGEAPEQHEGEHHRRYGTSGDEPMVNPLENGDSDEKPRRGRGRRPEPRDDDSNY